MSRANRLWGRLRMVGFLLAAVGASLGLAPRDWRGAGDEPAGLAPDPSVTPEAVVQVYGARVSGWRGIFGVHTWIAAKPTGAISYTIYEVVGWRLRWADSAVAIGGRKPDGHWYGARPHLLADLRGEVDGMIERIDSIARNYRHADRYRVWPGPNSNTFVAMITRAIPELAVDFPPTAIGKDYLGARLFGPAPSGRGFQFSLLGLVAVTASSVEGLEINLLTLTFGINPFSKTVKLPIFGTMPMRGFGLRSAAPRAVVPLVAEPLAEVHPWPTRSQMEHAEPLRRAA